MSHPTNNPAHYHPFPTEHLAEFGIYDEVRPDPTQAPTGMTLKAGQETKRWTDELGIEHAHPAAIEYRPADAGQGGALTTTVHTDTLDTRTYTNTIVWHDRLNGPERWTTRIQDSVGPTDYTLEWLVVDGSDFDLPGPPGTDTGLPGTGAGKQCLEYHQERYPERVENIDTYAHHNPTQNGAGQAAARDVDSPWGGYTDSYSRRRVYGGGPMHYSIAGDVFEAGGTFTDFDGDGTLASDGTVAHANFGQDAGTQARIWTSRRFFQRTQVNYKKGTLTNSAAIHRTDYWMHSPTAWTQRGVSGPVIHGMSHNQSMKTLHFTKGFVVDLALGAASAIDVDDFVSVGGDTFAPPGPSMHWQPSWTQTTNELFLENADPFSTTNTPVPGSAGSPYRAAVVYDPVNDFGIAHACKLGHAVLESGRPQAHIDGRPCFLTMFRFINPETTGSLTQGFADNISCECKSTGIRRAGWIGMVSFTVIGTIADIKAALDELYDSGELDEEPVEDLPAVMTEGTIFPPGSGTPTALGTAQIVFLTGDSQACVGEPAFLRADQNPELSKFSQFDPL